MDAESDAWQPSSIQKSEQRNVVTVAGQTERMFWNTEGNIEVGRTGGEVMKYTVIYERGPSSWGAYVPDLPDVISVGETRSEVEQLIHEAVEFHLDGMREEGMAIPAASSFAGELEVRV